MATKKKNGSPPARRSAFEVIDPVFEDIVPAGEPPGPDHLRLPILPDKPEATEAAGPIAETLRRLFDQIAEVLEAKGLAGWELEFVLDSADPPGALRALAPRGQARLLKLVRS